MLLAAFSLTVLLLAPASITPAAADTATLISWGCDTIVGVTQGNPTTLTCNTPHGWDTGKSLAVQLYGGTGAYARLNTRTGNYGLLRKSVQVDDTSLAVGDASPASVGEQVMVDTGFNGVQETFTVTAINGYLLTVNPPAVRYHGTGGFLSFNSDRGTYLLATAIDATHLTVPVDTRGLAAFTGVLTMRRSNLGGALYGRQTYGSGVLSTVSNGMITVTNPAPADPTNAADVAGAYASGWTISFSAAQIISNITVYGGIATINFTAAFPYMTQANVGGILYVKGAPDNRLNDVFVLLAIALDNTSVIVTAPAGLADGVYTGPGGAPFDGASIVTPAPFYLDWMPMDTGGHWSYPSGFMQSQIESGTFDPAMNRLTMWTRLSGTSYQRIYNSATGSINFGSYTKGAYTDAGYDMGQEGNHFYHQLNPNIYDGVWVKTEVTAHPTYQRSCPGYLTNDPTWNGWTGGCLGYAGDRHYFDALNRFYYVYSGGFASTIGKSVSVGPITLSKRTGEPDSTIGNVMAMWAPARFTDTIGCGNGAPACTGATGKGPGYEVSWTVPTYSVSGQMPSYEVRRGTTSLKVAGFSTGVCNDGTTTCAQANGDIIVGSNTTAIWASSDTSVTQPAAQYIGIRPKLPVWSTTGAGVSPILIYTHDSTDMAPGDRITIAGVRGNTAANQTNAAIAAVNPEKHFYRWDSIGISICGSTNTAPIVVTTCAPHGLSTGTQVRIDQDSVARIGGYWTVTVSDPLHFSLNGSAAAAPVTWAKVHGPGSLVQIAATSGSCVATTTSAHGLQVGQPIAVSNSANATLNAVDGAKITAASSTTFTFPCAGVADGAYANDFAGPNQYQGNLLSIRAYSSVAVPGTGDGAYASGGTLVSTEEFKNFYEIEVAPFTPGPQVPSHRLGGSPVKHGAVILYNAPDDAPCSAVADDHRGNLATFVDDGGVRSRAQALAGLQPGTSYRLSVNCSQGSIQAGQFATAADAPDTLRTISTSGGKPLAAAAADNLVASYGATTMAADQVASAACASRRCSVSFPAAASSVVWVRRLWCKNRGADPSCRIASNELARSAPEAVAVP